MSGAFEKLLGELNAVQAETDTLAKALPAEDGKDDKKIQAAAAEGGADGDDDKDDMDGDDKPMAKSMQVTLPDGTVAEAIDGTEMLKALSERLDGTEGTLAKAMGQAVSLIKSQGEMIKSLAEQVKKLSSEGRGRKTVVSITEKTPAEEQMAKGGDAGLTVESFLAKSHAAWQGGKITGKEFTTIDVACRSGVAVDPTLISKVVG